MVCTAASVFGFPAASRISLGTERTVTVLISASGWNIMGLVRVQAIRDWKGDLRADQYRILAFIICHNSLRCNILLTNPKVVNNNRLNILWLKLNYRKRISPESLKCKLLQLRTNPLLWMQLKFRGTFHFSVYASTNF